MAVQQRPAVKADPAPSLHYLMPASIAEIRARTSFESDVTPPSEDRQAGKVARTPCVLGDGHWVDAKEGAL